MYLISTIILWICIAANIWSLVRGIRLNKEPETATDSTYEAWKNYLMAEQKYLSMAEEVRADKEQLRILHEDDFAIIQNTFVEG